MLSRCDQDGCTGHLGKFSSCLHEALWELSMDGWGTSTGRTEAHGHFTAITLDEPHEHDLGGVKVMIPAGWYMVTEDDHGFVYVITYASAAELDQAFDEQDQRYGEWLEINEPE